jgi:hypothetical protein
VEPQSPMTQYKSSNEGSRNEGNSYSYECPSPPEPPCAKTQRSSGPQDPDYIQEQAVLSGSCTPGTAGRRLWPKRVYIRPSSIWWQTVRELSTPYQIWSHLSWLKGSDCQLKRTKPRRDMSHSFYPTIMVVGGQDLATCQPNLTHPGAPAQHTPGPSVPMPGCLQYRAGDP